MVRLARPARRRVAGWLPPAPFRTLIDVPPVIPLTGILAASGAESQGRPQPAILALGFQVHKAHPNALELQSVRGIGDLADLSVSARELDCPARRIEMVDVHLGMPFVDEVRYPFLSWLIKQRLDELQPRWPAGGRIRLGELRLPALQTTREGIDFETGVVQVVKNGGIGGNSSGDIFIAFSTANPGAGKEPSVANVKMLPNDRINPIFLATVQATEEAIINAMIAAETMTGADGIRLFGLPGDRVVAALKKYNRMK